MSDEEPKLIAIDEEANHQIVHGDRFGKGNGTMYKPFNPGPQIDVSCALKLYECWQCENGHIPLNYVVTPRCSHSSLDLSICYPHDVSSAPPLCEEFQDRRRAQAP